jgi:hypothetical protein
MKPRPSRGTTTMARWPSQRRSAPARSAAPDGCWRPRCRSATPPPRAAPQPSCRMRSMMSRISISPCAMCVSAIIRSLPQRSRTMRRNHDGNARRGSSSASAPVGSGSLSPALQRDRPPVTEGLGASQQRDERSRSRCFPDPPASRRWYSAPLPCPLPIPRAHSDKLQLARRGFHRRDRRRN